MANSFSLCGIVITREAFRSVQENGMSIEELVGYHSIHLYVVDEVAEIVDILESGCNIQSVIFELGHQKIQIVGVMSWIKRHRPSVNTIAIYKDEHHGLVDIANMMNIRRVIDIDELARERRCITSVPVSHTAYSSSYAYV